MSGFPILDLVIGVIFIFFLVSIICSSGVELWLSVRRTRARILEEWLERIFNQQALSPNGLPSGKTVGQEIMDHCMVTGLSGTKKSPTYIDSQNFVSALLDQITRTPSTGQTFIPPPANLAGFIASIQNSPVIGDELKRTILLYANEAQMAATVLSNIPAAANAINNVSVKIKSELEHFRDRLERWYDTNGDRLTASFKRKKVVPLTIIIGTIITVAMNIDTIAIGKYLYDHPAESKQLSENALRTINQYEKRVDTIRLHAKQEFVVDSVNQDSLKKQDSTAQAKLNQNVQRVKQDIADMKAALPSSLPLGWKKNDAEWWKHIPGWLASILAICLGAPFWFDILNKIANLRSTGPKPIPNTSDSKTE